MPARFLLKCLTPSASVFEGEVESVVLPGEEGEFGLLAGHTSFTTLLKCGIARIASANETFFLALSGGFAEVHSRGATVLADAAERPDQIDVLRAQKARDQALDALRQTPPPDATTTNHWKDRLARAENRLRAANIKGAHLPLKETKE
jgi:F-type H+-transporting ATPase subunit epsilon